jgi:hypothetical protein
MNFDFWAFFLDNLEAAGVIGGYVSISIIGVALITLATTGKTRGEGQIGPKWTHPLIGGLLGVIPGCGATIVISSMYKNQKITFGGLLAAFIATLGEGSFVLLGASDEADVAANLTAFAIVNSVGLTVGVFCGYLVDVIRYRATVDKNPEKASLEQSVESRGLPFARNFVDGVGFYIILAIAVFLAPGSIMALWGGGIDAIEDVTLWVATALTLICIIYYIASKLASMDHCCTDENEDVRSALLNSIVDIAMVVTFVFIGLFVANYIIDVLVGAETFDAWMTSSAFVVVLLAALIGLIPGCGGMIAVAVAFITIPNFPMAALIAAAIATSGDGIFPLLAENRKDGVIVSGVGFLVAIVVGYAALALEI